MKINVLCPKYQRATQVPVIRALPQPEQLFAEVRVKLAMIQPRGIIGLSSVALTVIDQVLLAYPLIRPIQNQ